MKDKIAKLPKWAQEMIRRSGYLEQRLNEVLNLWDNRYPKSNTWFSLWADDSFKKHYLPDNTQVNAEGDKVGATMHIDQDGNIRIYFSNGLIMPQARNCIYIVPETTK